jgi:hypothetical protein
MFTNGAHEQAHERDIEVEIQASCQLAWRLLGDLAGWPLTVALDTPT